MGIACKRGQTLNLLDTQIGLVEAGLGIAVISSFGVLASRDHKVRNHGTSSLPATARPRIATRWLRLDERAKHLGPPILKIGVSLESVF
jgi:hypothetical protein